MKNLKNLFALITTVLMSINVNAQNSAKAENGYFQPLAGWNYYKRGADRKRIKPLVPVLGKDICVSLRDNKQHYLDLIHAGQIYQTIAGRSVELRSTDNLYLLNLQSAANPNWGKMPNESIVWTFVDDSLNNKEYPWRQIECNNETKISEKEVEVETVVVKGATGSDGVDGVDGRDGRDGVDGVTKIVHVYEQAQQPQQPIYQSPQPCSTCQGGSYGGYDSSYENYQDPGDFYVAFGFRFNLGSYNSYRGYNNYCQSNGYRYGNYTAYQQYQGYCNTHQGDYYNDESYTDNSVVTNNYYNNPNVLIGFLTDR